MKEKAGINFKDLNTKEKEIMTRTIAHSNDVEAILDIFSLALKDKGVVHDFSKIYSPFLYIFTISFFTIAII